MKRVLCYNSDGLLVFNIVVLNFEDATDIADFAESFGYTIEIEDYE